MEFKSVKKLIQNGQTCQFYYTSNRHKFVDIFYNVLPCGAGVVRGVLRMVLVLLGWCMCIKYETCSLSDACNLC